MSRLRLIRELLTRGSEQERRAVCNKGSKLPTYGSVLSLTLRYHLHPRKKPTPTLSFTQAKVIVYTVLVQPEELSTSKVVS